MQACSVVATPWFALTVIHLIPARGNRKNSCHYQERKGKRNHKKTQQLKISESLRKLPSAPNMVKKMPSMIFPLVIRFAKVDLQGIKTWKHLKYQ